MCQQKKLHALEKWLLESNNLNPEFRILMLPPLGQIPESLG